MLFYITFPTISYRYVHFSHFAEVREHLPVYFLWYLDTLVQFYH